MLNKLVRITRDAEVKTTQNGKRMMSLSCVYDVGFGDNKKPVWCDFTMFGDRIEKLVSHLQKGSQVVVSVSDVEPNAYQKNDGTTAVTLRGVLQSLEFASKAEGSKPQQAQQSNANDFDDSSIPF